MKLFLSTINIKMFFIAFLLFSFTTGLAQVKLVSWNIQNFGKSKSAIEINYSQYFKELRYYCHSGSSRWLRWRTSSS
jgi:hypothetical protein